MNPRALVSIVTPPMLAVFRLPAATAAELLVPVEDWPNELHAARPAAIAATTSRRQMVWKLASSCSFRSPLIKAGNPDSMTGGEPEPRCRLALVGQAPDEPVKQPHGVCTVARTAVSIR